MADFVLRRDISRNQYPPDDGSPDTVEAMHQAGLAALRRDEPWRFTDDDEMDRLGIDRRAFHPEGDCG